jgi:hypothetical protein
MRYVTDKREYLGALKGRRRLARAHGQALPGDGGAGDGADGGRRQVEIETTAVVPEGARP